jgi:hypothetical protein
MALYPKPPCRVGATVQQQLSEQPKLWSSPECAVAVVIGDLTMMLAVQSYAGKTREPHDRELHADHFRSRRPSPVPCCLDYGSA